MKSSKATTNGSSLARNDTEDYQQNYLQSVTTSLEQISSIPLSPKVASEVEQFEIDRDLNSATTPSEQQDKKYKGA